MSLHPLEEEQETDEYWLSVSVSCANHLLSLAVSVLLIEPRVCVCVCVWMKGMGVIGEMANPVHPLFCWS